MSKLGEESALGRISKIGASRSTLLAIAVLFASASCAPRHSRVSSVKTVTGNKEGKGKAQPQPVAVQATANEVGLQLAAYRPLLCPTWLIETGSEERERVNTVNGVALTLEWVASVAALGVGGVVSADAFLRDDAEREFESYASQENQRFAGGATVSVGLLLGIASLVDSLKARDETLATRTFEQEKPNSRVQSPCGQEAAASLTIQIQIAGRNSPHALGTTDATGKLDLQWQALPVSLFENRPKGGNAELTVEGAVVATLSLEAGWDVHANAAWDALPAGKSDELAGFHTRFPGARPLDALKTEQAVVVGASGETGANAEAQKEETTRQLAALEAALQANDLEVASSVLESLKTRVDAQVIQTFEKRLGVLEASLGKEQALTQAKEAVAQLSKTDAGTAEVLLAQKAVQRARSLGVDEFAIGATATSLAQSTEAIVTRKTREALLLDPPEGLPALKKLHAISPDSKVVDKAIQRVTTKALQAGLKAAKKQGRNNEFAVALDTLTSLEELIGSQAKLERERENINKAQQQARQKEEKRQAELVRKQERAEKLRLAAEARAAAKAAKLEERRLAAEAAGEKKAAERLAQQQAQEKAAAERAESRRLADAAAKLAEEERAAARKAKREEAQLAAAARAAERDARRATARAAAEEKKAAAKAAAEQERAEALARQEATRLAKAQARELRRRKQEEAKQKRLGTSGGTTSQAPIASYLEFELDKSLAKADALSSLILPAGCQAKVTNVVATPPACPGCKATPMRRVQLSCPLGSVDFLKLERRVWARCLTSSCASCQQLATASISNLAVSTVMPKVVQSCSVARP